MTDGLASAVFLIVVIASCIAAGLAWWVNRPQRAQQEQAPRIQPLFGSEKARALDFVKDEGIITPHSASASNALASNALASNALASNALGPNALGPNVDAMRSPPMFADQRPPQSAFGAQGLPDPIWNSAAALTGRGAVPPAATRRQTPFSSPPRAGPALGQQRNMGNAASDSRNGLAGSYAPPPSPAFTQGEAVRFSIPTDRTLQFLPGRLEITSGQDTGREIRFVRLQDPDGPEITFGRNEGPAYRHVQLRDGTVSRMHARLRLRDGRWTLTNLSTTNPVTYNGRVLGDGEEQVLETDDRIEMGEVAFRFRSR